MRIRRKHQLTVEEAKIRADEIAEDLRRRFSLTTRWQGDSMIVSGSGVNGALHIEKDALEIVINLGFALKLMEGPIRSVIEESIDDHLS
jgi:putative polyhydroxyalkanoate system protein